jgi:RNA polymerase sigma factor (sigma-70 family)
VRSWAIAPTRTGVVQEALLAGWQRTGGPVSVGWLRSVVRSRAIDMRRRLGRRGPVVAVDPQTADTALAWPEAIAEHLEVQQALLQALQELAPHYRDALYLRYFEDLGSTEIASRLDVPVKTIKSQLSRGLERLHALLGDGRGDRKDGRTSLSLGLILLQPHWPFGAEQRTIKTRWVVTRL